MASALESTHPLYDTMINDWHKMRDLYSGQSAVKAAGTTYLPATPSMIIDGMAKGQPGYEIYQGYLRRAVFYEYVKEGVEALVGIMHRKPPIIELSPRLEAMRERATNEGESLEQLLRRINENQLVAGRLGLLGDFPNDIPVGGVPTPFISLYVAEAIRNWDSGNVSPNVISALNMVVLDESGPKRDDTFSWKPVMAYRVLMLGAAATNELKGVYTQGLFTDEGSALDYNEAAMVSPMYKGSTIDELPFIFVNTKDITTVPDTPPLLNLGNLSLAIYQADADYRQNLFMQGQDTFVTIGSVVVGAPEEESGNQMRTGAGAYVGLEAGGDAKYVGVNSQGLPEQRASLENDKKQAETLTGKLVDARSAGVESGEALKTRIAAQTATLTTIALTGAAGLQAVLRVLAKWVGDNPEEVVVTPNMDFGNTVVVGKDILDLVNARALGTPLSFESIHAFMYDRGISKFDFETELEKIAEENANLNLGTGAGGGLTGNEPDGGDGSQV